MKKRVKKAGLPKFYFLQLEELHFPLLLKWLETPHVKKYWDQEMVHTFETVSKKYTPYVLGYKLDGNLSKPLYAYIIYFNELAIGYIQYYNFYDFPREYDFPRNTLPISLGAVDLFIGEPNFTGQGLGSQVLELFTSTYVFKKFDNCFVDPDVNNIAAVKAYRKAGFIELTSPQNDITWLIKENIL